MYVLNIRVNFKYRVNFRKHICSIFVYILKTQKLNFLKILDRSVYFLYVLVYDTYVLYILRKTYLMRVMSNEKYDNVKY